MLFVASSPQHLGAPQPYIGRQFLGSAGLTYAWLSHQPHQPASTRQRVFQASLQLAHLPLAAHEDAPGQAI